MGWFGFFGGDFIFVPVCSLQKAREEKKNPAYIAFFF